MANPAKRLGRKADDSKILSAAVRVGLIAYGVVHLLIAWLAVRLATGGGGKSASKDGALKQVAAQPLGSVLLYLMAAGFVALVIWQLIETFAGHREKDGGERKLNQASSAAKVGIFGFFGFSSFKLAASDGSGGGDKTEPMTAKILSFPAGQILVAVVGLVVIGYGCSLIYRGITEGFRKDLESQGQTGELGKTYVGLGKIGHVGKGVAFLVIGGLFLWAAWTHDADKAGGLDQALRKVLEQPYGSSLLGATAFGIGCYGLFCLAWARHLDR
ncbi:MAG: DUF1206 domain-containing protein [Actinomycetota bacterium]|nr:DUF1206 domain-containing protein [Actinomycetota bacterium]